jgi:hypothetical protein
LLGADHGAGAKDELLVAMYQAGAVQPDDCVIGQER